MAEERASSRTALAVAALRAAHQSVDQKPLILEDPVAARLLDPAALDRMREKAAELNSPGARGLRSHVVLRSRFAEDCLRERVETGLAQFVILGAGLDTFAYRQPAWARSLRVFEVDHPASQEAKRARLRAGGLDLPSNLTFAPVDFESSSLQEGLEAAGVDFSSPAFFSWLGVTMYLTEEAIDAVLRLAAGFPAGSAMILTFAQPDDGSDATRTGLADKAAQAGEPWIARFTPRQMEARLRDAGFSSVFFLSPEEAANRYYRDRTDGLPPPRKINTALAEV
ncbi:MAG TPA: class I SAM-dependent methyltransferase [Holophagaceae bacterium]|nr:class I SAM-dependent methyltransferase [Holophagaceae bacterium]